MEALAYIRRSHPSWARGRVWMDDAYLESVMRTVGGASRFRRHGAAATLRLKSALMMNLGLGLTGMCKIWQDRVGAAPTGWFLGAVRLGSRLGGVG